MFYNTKCELCVYIRPKTYKTPYICVYICSLTPPAYKEGGSLKVGQVESDSLRKACERATRARIGTRFKKSFFKK